MRQAAGGCKRIASWAFVGDNGGMKRTKAAQGKTGAPSAASFLAVATDYPPRLKSLVEMAVSKFFPDVEEDAPEWAKRAAKLAFASAMPPNRKRNASENYLAGFRCGELFGAAEMLPPAVTVATLFGIRYEREFYASRPSDEAADFFAGLRDGEKWLREMPKRATVVQTVKAFRTIAADWREASECEGNAGELHGWLIDKGAIFYKTDPATTRRICGKIGFPKGEAGRPPEKK
jgi:hypothetical protein